jgi:hypothetical protein
MMNDIDNAAPVKQIWKPIASCPLDGKKRLFAAYGVGRPPKAPLFWIASGIFKAQSINSNVNLCVPTVDNSNPLIHATHWMNLGAGGTPIELEEDTYKDNISEINIEEAVRRLIKDARENAVGRPISLPNMCPLPVRK